MSSSLNFRLLSGKVIEILPVFLDGPCALTSQPAEPEKLLITFSLIFKRQYRQSDSAAVGHCSKCYEPQSNFIIVQ